MRYAAVVLSTLLMSTAAFANQFARRGQCTRDACWAAVRSIQSSTTATSATSSVHSSPSPNNCSFGYTGQNSNGEPSSARSCLSQEKAKYFVDSFKNLLEFTNYNGSRGGPKGRGFNTNLAKKILASDFRDFSDSINLLAQQPLGSTTFPSRAAFIAGQGAQPEVTITVLGMWFSCSTIAFRYRLKTSMGPDLPILGLNIMELDRSLDQVKTQYAEFNSGAWLVDLGNPECQKQGGNRTATQ